MVVFFLLNGTEFGLEFALDQSGRHGVGIVLLLGLGEGRGGGRRERVGESVGVVDFDAGAIFVDDELFGGGLGGQWLGVDFGLGNWKS